MVFHNIVEENVDLAEKEKMEEATHELTGSTEHNSHKKDKTGDNIETVAKFSINHK